MMRAILTRRRSLKVGNGIGFRFTSSSSSFTPGDAGKRAEELAKEQHNSSNNTAAMDTLLAHAGVREVTASRYTNKALAPPIELASTFTRPSEGPYKEGEAIYNRYDNPTRVLLEETVWELETAGMNVPPLQLPQQTFAFASGMMAASSIVLAQKLPLTILLPQDLYHGVSTVMMDVFQERFGVQVHRVDMRNVHGLEQELRNHIEPNDNPPNSILIWMETPSNPACHILDLQIICSMVKDMQSTTTSTSITTVVDSTLAPPVIQQPLTQGVDLVMHSGTKYIAGHSDALLGIVTASPLTIRGQELGPLLQQVQRAVGGVASPLDSWLALRGLRTLHVRVERQCQTALVLAKWLESKRASGTLIRNVHYPGLEDHHNHSVAQQQMKDGRFGGVLSVEFHSEHVAMAFAGALRTIHRATSLGGTETLIEERRSIEPMGRQYSPPGLLRITVGLEDPDDLIQDMSSALKIAEQVQLEIA